MAESAKAFTIEAAEGVSVHLDDSSEDDTFVVSVRKDGSEVEKHEGVTADSIVDVGSDHFSASHVDPPTGPAD